jgi:hypothetical protein
VDNPAAGAPMLQIAFRVYPQEVAFPPLWLEPNQIFTSLHIIIPPDDISARFNAILSATPLYKMTEEDRKLVWKYREFISATRPACISKVLSSVDWTDIKQVPSLGSKKKNISLLTGPRDVPAALELAHDRSSGGAGTARREVSRPERARLRRALPRPPLR